jgi:hypothetical protein
MIKNPFKTIVIFLVLQNILFASTNSISFQKDIQPVLDKRCVVCHSCYNSPCQLKLSSFEGMIRGATKEAIYENRIKPAKPTRLFIDASTTQEWSELEFYSVLKKYNQNSIMSRLLEQKQEKPNNVGNYDPENDELKCSKNMKELNDYLDKNPYHGMPYGFPALKKKKHDLLVKWLDSKAGDDRVFKTDKPKSLTLFENFLNDPNIKYQVSARYIYEHLFLAHIKFEGDERFYSLVRSYDQDAENLVKTRVPYGDPKKHFFYRFKEIRSTIVHKTHMVYELSERKLKRYEELFIKPKWDDMPYFPSYDSKVASNPLESFKQIPLRSRYEFMLDDIHYFIMTFIRGPVCRGQVALNVINDHFWVAFKDPDHDYTIKDKGFINSNFKNLSLPNEYGGDSDLLDVFSIYKYNDVTIDYYKNKNKLYKKYKNDLTFDTIWRGNKYKELDNDSVLTIYRHFDSASVHKGALGDIPRTMWIIDYPLLERLYYSLAAGFDVYGNTQHKVLVRKYMDRLRIEGESNFLEYLPKDQRKKVFEGWYDSILAKYTVTYTPSKNKAPLNLGYREFVLKLLDHSKIQKDKINYIHESRYRQKIRPKYNSKKDIEMSLKDITYNNGIDKFQKFSSNNFNLIYIRFKMQKEDFVYTMIVNRWHDNVAFMFNEKNRLDVTKDKINFVEGFLGSYPNYFVEVEQKDIPEFFKMLQGKVDESELSKFFINRNNKRFWEVYDWFQEEFHKQDPVKSGLFDLNRYYKKSI